MFCLIINCFYQTMKYTRMRDCAIPCTLDTNMQALVAIEDDEQNVRYICIIFRAQFSFGLL